MTLHAGPDIRPEHRAIVAGILRAALPAGAQVWAFGSRATGRARPYSDLDLAIDAGRPLRLEEHAALAEAFSESDLPYKVDLVDWRRIENHFRNIIADQLVALTEDVTQCGAIDAGRDMPD